MYNKKVEYMTILLCMSKELSIASGSVILQHYFVNTNSIL